jgi:hypothetical protein
VYYPLLSCAHVCCNDSLNFSLVQLIFSQTNVLFVHFCTLCCVNVFLLGKSFIKFILQKNLQHHLNVTLTFEKLLLQYKNIKNGTPHNLHARTVDPLDGFARGSRMGRSYWLRRQILAASPRGCVSFAY